MKIQEKIRAAEDLSRVRFPDVQELATGRVEDEALVQAVAADPLAKGGDARGVPPRVSRRSELFHPPDVAADLAQPLHVLHVNPEVTATLWVTHHVVRRDDDPHSKTFLAGVP